MKKLKGNQKTLRDKEKRKHNNPKSMGCIKSSFKTEVYRDTSLPQKTKISNNNLTLHLKN